jgi:hypothetical protein
VLEDAGGSLIRVSQQSKSEIGGIEESWSLIWNVTAEGLERPALERQRTENVEGLDGAGRSEGALTGPDVEALLAKNERLRGSSQPEREIHSDSNPSPHSSRINTSQRLEISSLTLPGPRTSLRMGSACAPIAGSETTDAKASNLQLDAGTEYALFLSIAQEHARFRLAARAGRHVEAGHRVVGKRPPAMICRSQPSA